MQIVFLISLAAVGWLNVSDAATGGSPMVLTNNAAGDESSWPTEVTYTAEPSEVKVREGDSEPRPLEPEARYNTTEGLTLLPKD
jgi:hypothetical protein